MYLPNGRSDGRSSPPAAKSSRFYRRGGAKSRPAAAKSCKIAVCAGTSSIYIAQPKNGNGYSKLILQAFLPPALRIADKMPASGKQGPPGAALAIAACRRPRTLLRCRQLRRLLGGLESLLLLAFVENELIAPGRHFAELAHQDSGSGRDQPPDDDIFLKAIQR